MLTFINAKFIFNCLFIGKFRRLRVIQYCKYSPNSTCRLSSCLLAVLAMFLASSSPISSPLNESVKCSAILYSVSTCFHISNLPLPFHLHLHEMFKFFDSETQFLLNKCRQSASLFKFKRKKEIANHEQESIPEC